MQPVIVTTEHRGVFFGYMKPCEPGAKVVELERARNCVYWSADVRGFMGLAVTGPSAGCKIGPAVTKMSLNGVTAIINCTDEATNAWERAIWA